MEFFIAAIEVLKTIIILLGCVLGAWGLINLLEAYGSDNPGSKSQGIKQLAAGVGVSLVGLTLIPLLKTLISGLCSLCPPAQPGGHF